MGDEVDDDDVPQLLEVHNETSTGLMSGWHKNVSLVPRKGARKTNWGRDVEFEVTPEIAVAVVGKSLSVGLSRCRVGPSVDVRRCHRCQRYGHLGVACKAPTVVCARCAGPHHVTHCIGGKVTLRCASCAATGWAHDHASGDISKCRTWERNFRRVAKKFKWTLLG